jgi:hypothetical protein
VEIADWATSISTTHDREGVNMDRLERWARGFSTSPNEADDTRHVVKENWLRLVIGQHFAASEQADKSPENYPEYMTRHDQ